MNNILELDFTNPQVKNMHLFDGPDVVPELDNIRLTKALARVFQFMRSGEWHTLAEITEATGSPQASASAHLRHLTEKDCGYNQKNKRRRGNPGSGLWEYQIIQNTTKQFTLELK